jgi:hypothetical protein
MSEAQKRDLPAHICPFCTVANPEDSRFCKACGAAISPPPLCPGCMTSIPNDARFCPGCGIRVLGPRSESQAQSASSQTAASTQVSESVGVTTPTSNHVNSSAPDHDEQDILHAGHPAEPDALASLSEANRNRRRDQGVGLGVNVLFFVAVLIAFVVAMYAWNKDRPKEANMFSGTPQAPVANNSTGAKPPSDTSKSIAGTVTVDARLAAQVNTKGVLYIIVRNAGMPTKGPPLAVRKFLQPSFPLAYSVGSANVMMKGLPFSGPFDVYVRLDRDGNAMTKDPDDLVTSTPPRGILPGDQAVNVSLDRRLSQQGDSPKKVVLRSPKASKSPSSDRFSGLIKVDGSLSRGSELAHGTVYIIVRPSGMPPVGPPLAVRKYDAPRFPLAFGIGPEHVMMQNMPFNGPFDVYVRWDKDGNAMTKQAGDLESSKPTKNVAKGMNSMVLTLDKKRE